MLTLCIYHLRPCNVSDATQGGPGRDAFLKNGLDWFSDADCSGTLAILRACVDEQSHKLSCNTTPPSSKPHFQPSSAFMSALMEAGPKCLPLGPSCHLNETLLNNLASLATNAA